MSATKIPGGLVIALQTGRPELARMDLGEKPSITELNDFAEAVVRDILSERENLRVLLPGLQMAVANLKGALRSAERMEYAVQLMLSGASAEEVSHALNRPADRG